MKWFHCDKDRTNDDFIQLETANESGNEEWYLLVSKHSWNSKNSFDGSKYKKNVAPRSRLCRQN